MRRSIFIGLGATLWHESVATRIILCESNGFSNGNDVLMMIITFGIRVFVGWSICDAWSTPSRGPLLDFFWFRVDVVFLTHLS